LLQQRERLVELVHGHWRETERDFVEDDEPGAPSGRARSRASAAARGTLMSRIALPVRQNREEIVDDVQTVPDCLGVGTARSDPQVFLDRKRATLGFGESPTTTPGPLLRIGMMDRVRSVTTALLPLFESKGNHWPYGPVRRDVLNREGLCPRRPTPSPPPQSRIIRSGRHCSLAP
jgi:hypothetical protein